MNKELEYDLRYETEEEVLPDDESIYDGEDAYQLAGTDEVRCWDCYQKAIEIGYSDWEFNDVPLEKSKDSCDGCGKQIRWIFGEY